MLPYLLVGVAVDMKHGKARYVVDTTGMRAQLLSKNTRKGKNYIQGAGALTAGIFYGQATVFFFKVIRQRSSVKSKTADKT